MMKKPKAGFCLVHAIARLRRATATLLACAAAGACAMQHTAPDLAPAGDPIRGLGYARSVCAGCHAVEPDDDWSPSPGAPSFESIANTPGMTARSVRVWLNTSHENMPNLIIGPDDADDVAAYLATLAQDSG